MGLPSLYNLTDNMLALLESDDSTPEQIEAAFGELQSKDNSICAFRADLKGTIDKFKAEEQRISTRRKAMENLVARLETYLRESMQRLGLEEIETGTFKITLSFSAGKVEIKDENAIPAEFKTITVSVNRDAIKQRLKAGDTVPGAYIAAGTTLRIR